MKSPSSRKLRSTRHRETIDVPTGPAVEGQRSGADRKLSAAVEARLLNASAAVLAEWSYPDHSRIGPSEVSNALAMVCDELRRASRGEEIRLPQAPPFLALSAVLEELRTRFVALADEDLVTDHPRDFMHLIRAFEAMSVAVDRDAAHRFAGRLSGHEAQQLVVEMAHDMRSPLGSILILADRLRTGSGGALTPIQQRQLGLIYSAAFGLSAIAGDVIELARGGTTLVDQERMAFSVAEILQSTTDILRPMAEEKHLQLRVQPPTSDVRQGFPTALSRVLLNLATNAIKFTNAGSVGIICEEKGRTHVEFSVTDTGRGIPHHVLANLFETFRQRQVAGDYFFSSAGLGLSICQTLIRAMGGELQVETQLERGTRFHFLLALPIAPRIT